jgi:hypothetical protein
VWTSKSVSITGDSAGAIGAGCFCATTSIENIRVALIPRPGCAIVSSNSALGMSVLAGVHVTVCVTASNFADAGNFVTTTRVSSRS